MRKVALPSSSPVANERLIRVRLDKLHPHPANANVMSNAQRAKLARSISREQRYPPLIARPHPEVPGDYQLLDGHQRASVLRDLGHEDAACLVWACDDATALLLLATLNRLHGEDAPARRAELIAELHSVFPPEELAALLPEDPAALERTLASISVNADALITELSQALKVSRLTARRTFSIKVLAEDETVVRRALLLAAQHVTGTNRRGRALGLICRQYLDTSDG